MLAFFRFLHGYLFIRVSGFSPERFMNLCSSHKILLWNITPSAASYEMNISLYDFYRLKPIIRKTRTKVHILKRMGMPFLLAGWKKRKLFFAGFLLCLLVLIYLSSFIWAIDVQGNERLTKEMLLQFFNERKICCGMRKKEVNIDALEKEIRNEFRFITWTSVKTDGTRLTIYVKENDIVTGIQVKEEEYADLIADYDGVVAGIVTRRGVPYVKEKTEVKKGDVLIGGAIPIVGDDLLVKNHQFCRADGDVFIKSTKAYHDTLLFEYEEKKYTGKEKTAYSITIFSNTFDLFKRPRGGLYTLEAVRTQVKLPSDFYLPVFFEKKRYSEYVMEKKVYSKTEAAKMLQKNLRRFCKDLEEKGVQILEKNVKMIDGKNKLSMQGTLTVLKKADHFVPVSLKDETMEYAGEAVSE